MTSTVVVTGLGVAAPNGLGTRDFWAATRGGRSGIDRVARFDPEGYPARLAGAVPGFVAKDHLSSRLLPWPDHLTRLALVAADWALADAGVRLDELSEFDMGVITASSAGGFEFGLGERENLWREGGQYVSAYEYLAWFHAGGLDAVAQARRQIRKGTRLVVTGAVDATIRPWARVAELAGDRLSTSDDPGRAYLPFDNRAHGHVPGEGGAILVLESAAAAQARGAKVYGMIAGYGATFDPKPGSGREPGLRKAIELALADAGVLPGDVDMVLADAAAVPELDRVEAAAITSVFGPRGVPVTVPKTMTGRLSSGAAALDLAAAFLAMEEGLIPPTVNVAPAAEYDLDIVMRPRAAEVSTALVLARGYGGSNSAMVVQAADRPPCPVIDLASWRRKGNRMTSRRFTDEDRTSITLDDSTVTDATNAACPDRGRQRTSRHRGDSIS